MICDSHLKPSKVYLVIRCSVSSSVWNMHFQNCLLDAKQYYIVVTIHRRQIYYYFGAYLMCSKICSSSLTTEQSMGQAAPCDVIGEQQPPVHSPPVCPVWYSRCTELIRSLYFFRSSLLSSELSSLLSTNRDPPSSPSLSCGSAALWPAEPFCRGVSSSLAVLLLLISVSSAGRWGREILYTKHTVVVTQTCKKSQPKFWFAVLRHYRKQTG